MRVHFLYNAGKCVNPRLKCRFKGHNIADVRRASKPINHRIDCIIRKMKQQEAADSNGTMGTY